MLSHAFQQEVASGQGAQPALSRERANELRVCALALHAHHRLRPKAPASLSGASGSTAAARAACAGTCAHNKRAFALGLARIVIVWLP